VAVNVTLFPAQIVVADALIVTKGVTNGLTAILMLLLNAGLPVAQGVAFEVRITLTTSLLANVDKVKILLFVPAGKPFTCHWYVCVAPPFTGVAIKVTLVPAQMVVAEDVMLTLTGKFGFTVIVIASLVAGFPVLHAASLFARVFEEKVLLFIPTLEPFSLHWYEGVTPPFTGVAVKVTLDPEQIVVADAEILTLAGKLGFTIVIMALLVAGVPVAQVEVDVITTLIAWPVVRVDVVNVALLVPAGAASTYHWYVGVPPLTGVAVNVTLVPAQMVLSTSLETILTVAGKLGFTIIVTALLVAGLPVAHVAAEVMRTVTTSLFARVFVEKVLLFVPTLDPFILHWYEGVVPPFMGIAVKVTFVPEQIVVAEAVILTLAGKFGFTVIVMELLVAGLPILQFTFEVRAT
jgi:hypothetical protein